MWVTENPDWDVHAMLHRYCSKSEDELTWYVLLMSLITMTNEKY